MDETKEKFDTVLRLLDRDDQLINSRMTWYLTIQGFIVAGVALIFTGKFEDHQHLRTAAITLLSFLLGIAISLVVFISVRRARNAKKKVGDKWVAWVNEHPDEAAFFSDPRGDTSPWSVFTPGLSVPLILVVFWIIVIVGALI